MKRLLPALIAVALVTPTFGATPKRTAPEKSAPAESQAISLPISCGPTEATIKFISDAGARVVFRAMSNLGMHILVATPDGKQWAHLIVTASNPGVTCIAGSGVDGFIVTPLDQKK